MPTTILISSAWRSNRLAAGFTLAEAAMVLAVVGAVIGIVLPGLLSLRAAEQQRTTQSHLEAVMRAAAAFTQSTGCLPCPTPITSLSSGGVVRGDSSANPPACGNCAVPVGIPPYRSLGIPQSFAKDGFGHWLTYAVDTALTGTSVAVVPPTAACQTGDSEPTCTAADITNATRKKGLCQTGLSTTNRINVVLNNGNQKAAILVMSHGADGFGAFRQQPTGGVRHLDFPPSVPLCNLEEGTGAARCNTDDDINFVQALAAHNVPDPFDDQLLYFDRNAFIVLLGGPGCQTIW